MEKFIVKEFSKGFSKMILSDFYRSQKWRQLRNRLIQKRQNKYGEVICEYCNNPIYKLNACIGHHVIPITPENVGDYSISLNPDNIQLVHASCHNDIHNRYGISWERKVYIVYGSACSGKSSFVNENKTDGDLILDLDNIYQMLSNERRYKKVNQIKPIVFAVRETILEQIKMRSGTWRNAWVIGSLPYARDRQTLAERLNAETIFIDATQEECYERLENDPERQAVYEEWRQYIDEWFECYQAD